jgi:hypothetical protein
LAWMFIYAARLLFRFLSHKSNARQKVRNCSRFICSATCTVPAAQAKNSTVSLSSSQALRSTVVPQSWRQAQLPPLSLVLRCPSGQSSAGNKALIR